MSRICPECQQPDDRHKSSCSRFVLTDTLKPELGVEPPLAGDYAEPVVTREGAFRGGLGAEVSPIPPSGGQCPTTPVQPAAVAASRRFSPWLAAPLGAAAGFALCFLLLQLGLIPSQAGLKERPSVGSDLQKQVEELKQQAQGHAEEIRIAKESANQAQTALRQAGTKYDKLDADNKTLTEQKNRLSRTVADIARQMNAEVDGDKLLAAIRLLQKKPEAPTAEEIIHAGRDLLDLGRYEMATQVLDKDPAGGKPTADLLAARGEAHWKLYLHRTDKPRKDAPEVQKAIAALKAANTAPALFFLAHIEEKTGNRAAALQMYKQGADRYPNEAQFQGALNRLNSDSTDSSTEGRGKSNRSFARFLAAVMLTALQPPTANATPEPEPAVAFYKALELAKKGDQKSLKQAIDTIQTARKQHKARVKRDKTKNPSPLVDYEQEVFLRSCDQLKRYWDMQVQLAASLKKGESEQVTQATMLNEIKSAKSAQETLTGVQQELTKATNTLDALRKALNAKSTNETDLLAAVKKRLPGDGDAKLRNDLLPPLRSAKALGDDDTDVKKGVDTLVTKYNEANTAKSQAETTRNGLQETIKQVAQALESTEGRKDLLDAVGRLKTLNVRGRLLDLLRKAKALTDTETDLEKGINALIAERKRAQDDSLNWKGKLESVAGELDRPFDGDLRGAVAALKKKLSDSPTKAYQELTDELERSGYVNAEQSDPLKGLRSLVHDNDFVARALTAVADSLGTKRDAQQIRDAVVRLKQNRTSEQMLPIWLQFLQDRDQRQLLQPALADANRVLQPIAGTPLAETRALALAVRGLALRNDGRCADAQAALRESVNQQDVPDRAWRKDTRAALEELTPPADYYLRRGRSFVAAGRHLAADTILRQGLAEFPRDGRMLALHSLTHLALAAQPGRPLTASDPLVGQANVEAQAAVAAGARAPGNFALGRIAEELGEWGPAEQHFREALKAAGTDDGDGGRYHLALARTLQRRYAPTVNKKMGTPATGLWLHTPVGGAANPSLWGLLGQLVMPTFVPICVPCAPASASVAPLPPHWTLSQFLPTIDEEPRLTPELDEAVRAADQAIRTGQYEGYLVKARIYAARQLWTPALHAYAEGLKHLLPASYAAYGDDLTAIVRQHPLVQRPVSNEPPDPRRAAKLYEAGRTLYFAGAYAEAEKAFQQAVRNDGDDARYWYFLGLSQLQQSKEGLAIDSFRQGRRWEDRLQPGREGVNASLERVQGPLRTVLSQYRSAR